MKTKLSILSLVLIMMICHLLPAEGQEAKIEKLAGTSQSSADMKAQLEEGIGYYTRRAEPGMNDKAIALYRAIIKQEPLNYDAGWRLAQALFWNANHEDDNKKALAYLSEGEVVAKKISEQYPDGKDGLFWYGVSLGRASERRGILNSLFAVGPMHDTMKKILEINPEDADAHHFLGVLYRKAPGWPLSIGDSDKSLDHAELSIKFGPEDVLSVLDLGRIMKAKGKKDEAKKLFEKVLTMPGLADRQPETIEYKEEAKEELAKLN